MAKLIQKGDEQRAEEIQRLVDDIERTPGVSIVYVCSSYRGARFIALANVDPDEPLAATRAWMESLPSFESPERALHWLRNQVLSERDLASLGVNPWRGRYPSGRPFPATSTQEVHHGTDNP